MSQSIRYYGVQSYAHRDLYVRVEHRPLTRFGLDGKNRMPVPCCLKRTFNSKLRPRIDEPTTSLLIRLLSQTGKDLLMLI